MYSASQLSPALPGPPPDRETAYHFHKVEYKRLTLEEVRGLQIRAFLCWGVGPGAMAGLKLAHHKVQTG